MKRYWSLFKHTFVISTNVMLVYRANIIFFLIFETMFLAAQFMIVSVGFDLAGASVAGWTKDQAFLLTAVNGLSHQFFICFFINPIFGLSSWVWNGQYDYILLKPIHPLAGMFFFGQFVISNVPNLVVNLGLVLYFMTVNYHGITVMGAVMFAVLVGLGVFMRLALGLICVAPVFLSERLADVEDSFWAFASLARYPLSVYPKSMVRVLTFVVPIGMLASLPASFFFGLESAATIAGAVGATIGFCVAAVGLFMLCLRRYQSVNSGL